MKTTNQIPGKRTALWVLLVAIIGAIFIVFFIATSVANKRIAEVRTQATNSAYAKLLTLFVN